MAFRIFGWEIRKTGPEKRFTDDDRLASFILMSRTEDVNRLFSPHGFNVQITEEERRDYSLDGKVPYRIALAAKVFRSRFISQIHRLLTDDTQDLVDLEKAIINSKYSAALDTQLLAHIIQATHEWERSPNDIPYFCLFDYVPLNRDGEQVPDTETVRMRQMVWNFKYNAERVSPRKHVTALYDAVVPLAAKLNESFDEVAAKLTLFCIPASDEDSQWMRYREFSRMLCRLTDMTDSFRHVHISAEKVPSHLGGEKKVNYTLDKEWFRDKVVVVFDDVLTTGESLGRCTEALREAGALVVAACFLGRTVKKE